MQECQRETCCFWPAFYNRWPGLSFCLGTRQIPSQGSLRRVSHLGPECRERLAHTLKLLPDKGKSGSHFSSVLIWRDLRNPQIILSFYAVFFFLPPWQKVKPPHPQSHRRASSFLILLALSGYPLWLVHGRGLLAAVPLFSTVQP